MTILVNGKPDGYAVHVYYTVHNNYHNYVASIIQCARGFSFDMLQHCTFEPWSKPYFNMHCSIYSNYALYNL